MCGFIQRGACVVLFSRGGMRGFFSFFGYNEIWSMSGAVRILLECILLVPVCDSVHMVGCIPECIGEGGGCVSQHALGWGVSAGLGVCPRSVCPGGVHPPQDQMQTPTPPPPPSETKIPTYIPKATVQRHL